MKGKLFSKARQGFIRCPALSRRLTSLSQMSSCHVGSLELCPASEPFFADCVGKSGPCPLPGHMFSHMVPYLVLSPPLLARLSSTLRQVDCDTAVRGAVSVDARMCAHCPLMYMPLLFFHLPAHLPLELSIKVHLPGTFFLKSE